MAQVKVSFSNLKSKYGYVIRYAVLPADSIINLQGPDRNCSVEHSEVKDEARQRVAQTIMRRRNKKDGFYNKLEADILENGVENPLLVYAGKVPDYLISKLPVDVRTNPRQIVACIHGGSRLWFAQKHKIKVPCVIVDWIDKFKDARMIHNEGELLNLYKAPPVQYKISITGLAYNSLPHYHLER